jgi:hypothetical protein
LLGAVYDIPLELDEPDPELELEPMFGQFELFGVLGVVPGVVLGVVVVELPLAAQAPPPAVRAAAATIGAM